MITGLRMLDVLRSMSAQILSTFQRAQVFVAPIQIVTTQLQVITAHANWDMKTGRRTQVVIMLRSQYVICHNVSFCNSSKKY